MEEQEVLTWFETPTIFWSQPHNTPLPMKLVPKHSALMLLVNRSAGMGTPLRVVHENILGAWGGEVTERPDESKHLVISFNMVEVRSYRKEL